MERIADFRRIIRAISSFFKENGKIYAYLFPDCILQSEGNKPCFFKKDRHKSGGKTGFFSKFIIKPLQTK
ncbi:MAG TPA: hypothetical protein H9778_00955, partial [Candidatus Parabacteroides intestinavium]|nr:hypothetical protein [Candidatus Parabacteroides intestinavium]